MFKYYYHNGRLYFNFQIKLNPSNCIIHIHILAKYSPITS